ncbi:MAG: hypothetical protein HYU27_00550 [Acidobacteria bacterium]|nr:hypothetical protein [Acidobacteriota bacterium]
MREWISGIQRFVFEQQLQIAVPCAQTAALNDFGRARIAAAVPSKAVVRILGGEGVVVDADVLP